MVKCLTFCLIQFCWLLQVDALLSIKCITTSLRVKSCHCTNPASASFFCASMRRWRQLAAPPWWLVGEKIKQQIFGRNLAYSANADVRILNQEPSRAGLIFLHLARFKMHDGSNQWVGIVQEKRKEDTKVKSNCKMHLEFVFLLTFCHQQRLEEAVEVVYKMKVLEPSFKSLFF